ncbi:MAG: DUF255 domain-containing protein [Verrucomicrobia bacterium]|nr:MAG: DUF255 domain-containing protein [Verrucomicrobiota bacterium]
MMFMHKRAQSRWLLLGILALMSGLLQQARAEKSVATMVAEQKIIAPNSKFTLALTLEHPSGWHSYYMQSGGIEMPPEIRWELPPGFTAGPIQWPTPQIKDGFSGKSFIYSGSPTFLIDLTAPADLVPGSQATLRADASWQICETTCIDEQKSFTLNLTTGEVLQLDPAQAKHFAQARAQLPIEQREATWLAKKAGDQVLIEAGKLGNFTPIDFVPNVKFLRAASDGGEIRQDGENWTIRLNRATEDLLGDAIPQGDELSGILLDQTGRGLTVSNIFGDSGTAPAIQFSNNLPLSQFFWILGYMFLGGMILNLMPCVFPVIGLKIMGFVQQAGQDRKKVALHGMTFALGVFVSFAILSGVLFFVRLAGNLGSSDAGWGYQLQQPWMIFGLLLLMFVLALNLAGVFEMGTSATSIGGSLQSKQGLSGSFFSGVLATVVATPCSGPFLGYAIGAAIGLPAVQFFSAFAAMAAGLALPYLLLSMNPKLLNMLPRPGAWMETFKQAMSFFMFATAAYLLWVYAAQIGLDYLLDPLLALCLIAMACWIYGRWFLPHRSSSARKISLVAAVFLVIASIWLGKPPGKSNLEWQPWTTAAMQQHLAAGNPVYIDFTARWCATCQVNKRTAYTTEVIALMKKKKVIAMRADKTKANPEIDAMLSKLGRAAIPVNALMLPDREPILTPEVLTSGLLLELFEKQIPSP